MPILHVTTLVATGGLIKIEQAGPQVYKLMRHGDVDSYLGHISEAELRDLFDVAGDVITFIDTAEQHSLEQAS